MSTLLLKELFYTLFSFLFEHFLKQEQVLNDDELVEVVEIETYDLLSLINSDEYSVLMHLVLAGHDPFESD